MSLLSYEEQKEFFRLDNQYDNLFIKHNEAKVCMKNNQQFKQGLEAGYAKDSINLRRQYSMNNQKNQFLGIFDQVEKSRLQKWRYS